MIRRTVRAPQRGIPARVARRRVSGRLRASIAATGIVAVATGLGVHGTLAYFTDSVTANSGSFSSGTLDITVAGQLAGAANNGGTMTLALTAQNLLPGESVAYSFPVANNGSSSLLYGVTATGSGGLATTNGLQYAMTFAGSAATNTGTEAGGNRVGSCGTTVTDTNTQLLGSTAYTFAAQTRAIAANAQETACIVVRLNSNAGNTLQNLSGAATFVFSAKQPGA